ncbi:MAG: helix-turn-helix domain-containing protein [Lachnospiraceae bacterium]|nr:helix-turn-helix domain-containing protein [Lachnospiraceae bacterium]
MQNMERKTYTVPEVAMLLGISKSFAYELVKAKKIPVLEIEGRKLIPKKKFDNWLEGNEEESL